MTIARTSPHPQRAIVDAKGNITESFRTWTQAVTESLPLSGTGSPDGVIEAVQKQMYMDDAGTAGNILYIKKFADVGGDKKLGWILV